MCSGRCVEFGNLVHSTYVSAAIATEQMAASAAVPCSMVGLKAIVRARKTVHHE